MSHSNRFTASNSNISSNNNNNNQSSSEQELYLAKLKQTHKANGSRVSLASQHSPASSLASSVASNSSLAPESQKMHQQQHPRHQHNQHQHHHHSALHLSPAEAQRLSPAALAGQQALSGKPAPLSSKSAGNLIAPGGSSPPLAAKVGRVQLLQHQQQQHQQVDRSDSASLPSSTSTSESMFKRRLG